MKKLFIAFAIFLIAGSCYAVPPSTDTKGKLVPVLTEIDAAAPGKTKSIGDYAEFPNGLTFVKFFTPDGDINANYAKGNVIGNFTASRSASAPSTYVDKSGVIQLQTNSNVLRSNNRGFYNETGNYLRDGLLLEGASTNLITYSDDFSNTSWTKTNIAIDGESVVTPDGVTRTTVTLNATGTNGTVLFQYNNTAVPRDFSVYLKRKTGTGVIAITPDNVTWTNITLPATGWNRFSVTSNVTNSTPGIRIGTSGDKVYACLAQFENLSYPSSVIPTNGSVTSRPAESLSFSAANNFPAPYGNDVLSFDGTNTNYISGALSGYNSSQINRIEITYFPRKFTAAGEDIFNLGVVHGIRVFQDTGTKISYAYINATNVYTAIPGTHNITLNDWNNIAWWNDGTNIHITNNGANEINVTHSGFNLTTNPSFYLARRADNAVDCFISNFTLYSSSDKSVPILNWDFKKVGSGTTLIDTVGTNNGTINGATWSKDKHDFTILLAYCPVMLSNEQDDSYKRFFNMPTIDLSNGIDFGFASNAGNAAVFYTRSNGNNLAANFGAISSRYSPYVLVATGSTVPDSGGKRLNSYVNGALASSNTAYAMPSGGLSSNFSFQSSPNQSMILGAVLIWNRRLDANEVLVATNLVKEYLKWN